MEEMPVRNALFSWARIHVAHDHWHLAIDGRWCIGKWEYASVLCNDYEASMLTIVRGSSVT